MLTSLSNLALWEQSQNPIKHLELLRLSPKLGAARKQQELSEPYNSKRMRKIVTLDIKEKLTEDLGMEQGKSPISTHKLNTLEALMNALKGLNLDQGLAF